MGLWSSFKTLFPAQALLACVFIVSGLIVNFLMLLTYIFVWPWNKALYRKMVCNLGYSHWCQLVTLTQWWSGSNCTIHLEDPTILQYIGQEHTIVIMNHKYDIDWLMTWILSERLGMLGSTKIYGKSPLKFVPLIGWAWVFVECIFLKREWEKDKSIIANGLQILTKYPDKYWVTLLLFPEGTRFTEEKHVKSNEVARNKGLPELKHHLLPRTKGFVHTMLGLKNNNNKIKSILDLTVAMRPEGAKPTLMSVLNGKPVYGEVHVRRILVEDVPTGTEEECAAWLHKLFREKDEIYDNFVQNGKFTIGTKFSVPVRPHDLLVSLMWVSLVGIPLITLFIKVFLAGSLLAQSIMVVVVLLLSIIVRQMIAVTETEKGSKYGNKASDTAAHGANNNKKLQ